MIERDNNSLRGLGVSKMRMRARIARCEPGRGNEIEELMGDIVIIPEEGTTGGKERSLSSKETKIVSSYPLGWTKIKRY